MASAAARARPGGAGRRRARRGHRAAGLVFFAFAGLRAGRHARRRGARPGADAAPGRPDRAGDRAGRADLLVAVALLVGLGPERLAGESAPLAALVDAGRARALGVLVRVGAAVAAGSALLAVLVGLAGTVVGDGPSAASCRSRSRSRSLARHAVPGGR